MTARVVGCLVLLYAVAGSAGFSAQTVVRQDVQAAAALGPGFSLSVEPSNAQPVRMRWTSKDNVWVVEADSVNIAYSVAGIIVDFRTVLRALRDLRGEGSYVGAPSSSGSSLSSRGPFSSHTA